MAGRRLNVDLDEEVVARLESFKRIFDTVIGEESAWDEYVSVVLSVGLAKMLRDVIPEGAEWETIERIFTRHHVIVSDLIASAWKSMKEEGKVNGKRMPGYFR